VRETLFAGYWPQPAVAVAGVLRRPTGPNPPYAFDAAVGYDQWEAWRAWREGPEVHDTGVTAGRFRRPAVAGVARWRSGAV
jgi:hypothetical protein